MMENVARTEQSKSNKAEIIHLYVQKEVPEKSRHWKAKIKNGILASITILSFLLIVNCVGAWENNEPYMLPYVISAIFGAIWLTVFTIANNEELLYQYDDDEEDDEEEEDDYFEDRERW